jgi:hypothetical protein
MYYVRKPSIMTIQELADYVERSRKGDDFPRQHPGSNVSVERK